LTHTGYLWLLRQTVAHEIAHEAAGHATQKVLRWFTGGNFSFGASGQEVGPPWYVRLYNYPTEKELEADWIRVLEETRLGLPELGGYPGKFSEPAVSGRYFPSHRPPITASSEFLRVERNQNLLNDWYRERQRVFLLPTLRLISASLDHSPICTSLRLR